MHFFRIQNSSYELCFTFLKVSDSLEIALLTRFDTKEIYFWDLKLDFWHWKLCLTSLTSNIWLSTVQTHAYMCTQGRRLGGDTGDTCTPPLFRTFWKWTKTLMWIWRRSRARLCPKSLKCPVVHTIFSKIRPSTSRSCNVCFQFAQKGQFWRSFLYILTTYFKKDPFWPPKIKGYPKRSTFSSYSIVHMRRYTYTCVNARAHDTWTQA